MVPLKTFYFCKGKSRLAFFVSVLRKSPRRLALGELDDGQTNDDVESGMFPVRQNFLLSNFKDNDLCAPAFGGSNFHLPRARRLSIPPISSACLPLGFPKMSSIDHPHFST